MFENTEDKSKFQDSFLERFDALLFLSNSDEGPLHPSDQNDIDFRVYTVLDQDGKDAFQRYLDAGGNYIGSKWTGRSLGT